MRRGLRHCAVLFAMVMLTGGHWNVLQGLAWTTMLLTRSVTADVAQAVSTTFDGAHPCALCTMVDVGKAADGGDQGAPADDFAKTVKPMVKKDALPLERLALPVLVAEAPPSIAPRTPLAAGRREAPPVPPPLCS